MPRKVFISVLGTTWYDPSTYKTADGASYNSRYVQEAMANFLKFDTWSENDAAYILCTDEAKMMNWIVPEGKRTKGKESTKCDYCEGLYSIMKKYPFVEEVDIPDGYNEAEQMNIFSIVFDKLEEGDELYFDLTHGFRYLPMLILVLGNYAKFLKHTTIKSITYGNFEVSRKFGYSPIVDLLPLSMLQDWTFATADFIENGNADKIANVDGAEQNNNFTSCLSEFVGNMRYCRGIDIYNSTTFNRLKGTIESKNEGNPLHQHLLDAIRTDLDGFSTERSAANNYEAAKWCYAKGQYQACLTMLEESLLTLFCERYCFPIDNEIKREKIIKAAFYKIARPDKYQHAEDLTEEDIDEIEMIAQDKLMTKKLAISFLFGLCKVRNDFNHSGMRSETNDRSEMEASTKQYLDKFEDLFKQAKEEEL